MLEDLIIRPLVENSQSDYAALSRLYNYAYPEERANAVGLKVADGTRDEKLICERWFAEHAGEIVGVGAFEHWADFYDPDKYLLHVIVAPAQQNRGIGAALYGHAIANLEKLQPQLLQTWVQLNRAESVRFAERRGFERVKLKWNFSLDVPACNLAEFAEQMAALAADGVTIKPLSELADDAGRNQKYYDLYVQTTNSIEAARDAPPPDFAEFVETKIKRAENVVLIAEHAGKYVGLWHLEDASAGVLFGGAMGVDPEYRRRRVGLGLAVRGAEYAKAHGYSHLTVHTDEHNQAVLTLTNKMGYKELPAQILFGKRFSILSN